MIIPLIQASHVRKKQQNHTTNYSKSGNYAGIYSFFKFQSGDIGDKIIKHERSWLMQSLDQVEKTAKNRHCKAKIQNGIVRSRTIIQPCK